MIRELRKIEAEITEKAAAKASAANAGQPEAGPGKAEVKLPEAGGLDAKQEAGREKLPELAARKQRQSTSLLVMLFGISLVGRRGSFGAELRGPSLAKLSPGVYPVVDPMGWFARA